ncbi:MAG: peptidoglycan-associated lipoprotein Pal [Deltaproteobacteria bacterium]|nr:peptidoglycan-associated lipoprotein Pal [Deltaproteobacteria bacterium]
MRIRKIMVVLVVAALASGCACRTKKVGPGDSNIGIAEEGKELKDINFAFDSYQLDSVARSLLQKNAEWLKANPSRRVQVEGHADERGTNEYNMVLGANRARSAQDYLRSLGIESGRMSTVSYGEELPLDPRHNEEAWAKNRRAHFNVN